MSNKNEILLIDKAKEAISLTSDNALAKELGINRQLLWKVRQGAMSLPDKRIVQMCEMAKLDAQVWLAKIHEERADSKIEKQFWHLMLERLGGTAAALAILCGTITTLDTKTPNNAGKISFFSHKQGSLYIM